MGQEKGENLKIRCEWNKARKKEGNIQDYIEQSGMDIGREGKK